MTKFQVFLSIEKNNQLCVGKREKILSFDLRDLSALIRILIHNFVQTFHFANFTLCKISTMPISHQKFLLCKMFALQIFQSVNFLPCKISTLPISHSTNFPLCKTSIVQIFQFANFLLCNLSFVVYEGVALSLVCR